MRCACTPPVAQTVPQLTVLRLHKCSGLKGTTTADACARHLPELRSLDLSELRHKVGNKTLTAVASKLPALTALDVSGCTGFSDEGASALGAAPCLEDLTIGCQKLKVCLRHAGIQSATAIS
eukprot:SAG11_NODE_1268_length_5342_cov_1.710853_3_plen_122_part_00